MEPSGEYSRVASIVNLDERRREREERTYIVLGYPHGGTTLIAGLLRLAGIYMGQQIASGTNEDILFRQDESSALREAVHRRNRSHRIWGWKCPNSVHYLQSLRDVLVEPRLISITRDPFASTRRRVAGIANNEIGALDHWIQHTKAQLKVLRHFQAPTLLIGYERAIEHPQELVNALEAFLETAFNPATRARMVSYIQPRGGYTLVANSLELSKAPLPIPERIDDKPAGESETVELGFRELVDVNERDDRWFCESDDPMAFLDDESVRNLPGRRLIGIEVELPEGAYVSPKLYLDIGFGYSEEHTFDFGRVGQGVTWWRVEVPDTVAAARFDPDDKQSSFSNLRLLLSAGRL